MGAWIVLSDFALQEFPYARGEDTVEGIFTWFYRFYLRTIADMFSAL
jgi:hypothetical protein